MKQVINPFTGQQDHIMNRDEVAEYLEMTKGQLNFRWSDNCRLNEYFIPPRKVLHGIPKAFLSEIKTFKEQNKNFIIKPKADVEKNTENNNNSEIINFPKK